MLNSSFINFVFLLLFKHKTKHLAIALISSLIVFLLCSVMFVSNSIKNEILNTLTYQNDFTIQKISGGKVVDIENSLVDEFLTINGVSNVQQRVYGKYWFEPENVYFTIVGIDLFEKNTNKNIDNLLKVLNVSEFLDKNSMIIGDGVKKIFNKYQYKDSFDFKIENMERKNVYIFKNLPKEANFVANDLIIMDINLAKEILNIKEDEATDITLNVPNDIEKQSIKSELILKDSNLRIISKDDLQKRYEQIFNYKGGFFLILFLVVMITFILILFQRYSMINSSDKKEIGILKAVGWSIKDIIKLKILENFIVAFCSFLIGFILAYFYVFFLNAPYLTNIFIGFENIQNEIIYTANINFAQIFTLFIFFMIPFLSAVLIPVWKISVLEASKSMK